MFSDHLGLRGDYRYFRVQKTDGLQFGRGYGGLILAF
jgi:hypothetical protein